MFCFEFLRILEKNRKKGKPENLGKYGLPCPSLGYPRPSVGNPRRGIALRRNVGCLASARSRCPKGHPSGTLQRSGATPQQRVTPRCRHCSQREKLWIFVFEHLVCVHRYFKDPNK